MLYPEVRSLSPLLVAVVLLYAIPSPAVPAAFSISKARDSAADTDFVLPSGQHIPGERLSDIPELATQYARVGKAVADTFGVDIGAVTVHLVTIADLGALHAAIGGRLNHGLQLLGWELDRHVFVRRGLSGVPDEVLVHECLHALSRRFSNEAQARGVRKLVEGVTEHLTLRALAARPHAGTLKAEKRRVYVAYTELADALATLVGVDVLRAAYFGGGWAPLAARVDALRHKRDVLLHAAHVLEDGDEQGALAILTGARP